MILVKDYSWLLVTRPRRIRLLLSRENYKLFRDKYYPVSYPGIQICIYQISFKIGSVVPEPIQI